MNKTLFVAALALMFSLTSLTYAESSTKDKPILGFVHLGKTTEKQLVAKLKQNKCAVRKAVNANGRDIYRTDGNCYKLFGEPVITFITNDMGVIVATIINFYTGPNYENWQYYLDDLNAVYGPTRGGSRGFNFWKSGNISIALFPKSNENGEHESRVYYTFQGSTDVSPSEKTKKLL